VAGKGGRGTHSKVRLDMRRSVLRRPHHMLPRRLHIVCVRRLLVRYRHVQVVN